MSDFDKTKDRVVRKLSAIDLGDGNRLDLSTRQYDGGPVKLHIDRVRKTDEGREFRNKLGRITRRECELLGKQLSALAKYEEGWKS